MDFLDPTKNWTTKAWISIISALLDVRPFTVDQVIPSGTSKYGENISLKNPEAFSIKSRVEKEHAWRITSHW